MSNGASEDRRNTQDVDQLMSALLRGLLGPKPRTVVAKMDRLRASVRRLTLRWRLFELASAELTGNRELLLPLQRRTVIKALVSVGGFSHKPEVPRRLAVMAARGAFDGVLHTLVRAVRVHNERGAVTVRAYECSSGVCAWPIDSPATLQGPAVVIEVADFEAGIANYLRPELFDPSGGSVDLWLSRLIVRAHGGDLWLADNQPGVVFVAVWPMASALPALEVPDQSGHWLKLPGPMEADDWPAAPEEFGCVVRKAREAASLTREDFAMLAKISPSTLRNLETGRHDCTKIIRTKVVEHFARLGIAPSASAAMLRSALHDK